MEVALGQIYSISFIENNILKERLEKFDTALWNSSVQDFQCTETFGHFFSNNRKINHMYDLFFQLQKDLIPEECRGKQGYLKVFLIFVHEQLNLSTHFKFDVEKLAKYYTS
uniref:Uncharacterized protein n=1 Tax=Strongyloides venezuelensis TaxID=75913 RepID=A0A0K0F355_STRVS